MSYNLAGRKEWDLARKRFTSEQINTMLREAEVMVNQGSTVIEVARKPGIAEQTYYRWRKEYGGRRMAG